MRCLLRATRTRRRPPVTKTHRPRARHKDGSSAGRHKEASSGGRHKSDAHKKEKSVEVEHHKHVIVQPAEDAAVPLSPDLAAVKQASELVRQGKAKDATALAASIGDPVAAKLVEWARLRHADSEAGFDRYAAFIRANPDWPSMRMRRRAEARLWQERRDGATVRRFVGKEPTSALGRLALARVEMAEGDRAGAESKVRAVWRSEPLTAETETAVLAAFPDVLTRADHVARMDRRIGAKDFGAATRAAKHVGDDHVAIVKACSAAEAKSTKGGSLLDGVRADAREDLGYTLCRLHWLLRNDTPGSNVKGRIVTPKADFAAAVKLMLAASPEDLRRQDTDEWWRERRTLARKLLDIGDAATAYQVVRTAAPPANPYYRAEFHFMAGWIALRFLDDPATALKHFAHVDDGMTDPVPLARAAYWRGRAAEAAGQLDEMRAQYEAAARYPTAYYGQLARARLGLDDVVELRSPPKPADGKHERSCCTPRSILYRIGEGDLAMAFVSDLAEESSDPAVIAGLGKLTHVTTMPRRCCWSARRRWRRGLPMDLYAFPDIGVPNYNPVGSASRSLHRLCDRAHGKRLRSGRHVVGQGGRADAGHTRSRARHRQAVRRGLRLEPSRVRPRLQHADGRRRDLRPAQGLPRLLHPDLCRLQCGPRPGRAMDGAARRSARSQGRCGRLGRAHPVLRDAQLRPARHGEPAGLPRALRREHCDDRAQPASHGDVRVAARSRPRTSSVPCPPGPSCSVPSDEGCASRGVSITPLGVERSRSRTRAIASSMSLSLVRS